MDVGRIEQLTEYTPGAGSAVKYLLRETPAQHPAPTRFAAGIVEWKGVRSPAFLFADGTIIWWSPHTVSLRADTPASLQDAHPGAAVYRREDAPL